MLEFLHTLSLSIPVSLQVKASGTRKDLLLAGVASIKGYSLRDFGYLNLSEAIKIDLKNLSSQLYIIFRGELE